MTDMRARATQPELMDKRDCDPILLERTLGHFRTINFLFSRSAHLARKHILARMATEPSREYRILDAGSGGGDFALWLARALARKHLRARIVCLDSDPRTLAFAQRRCAGHANIEFVEGDVMRLDQLEPKPDFIFANHLLHHFADRELPALLTAIHSVARIGYVLSDLARSRVSLLLYGLFASTFLRRSFAFADGLLSIRRGFTRDELTAHIEAARLTPRPRVLQLWPGRLVIVGTTVTPRQG